MEVPWDCHARFLIWQLDGSEIGLELRAERARRDRIVNMRSELCGFRERAEREQLGRGLGVLPLLRDADEEMRT